MQIYHPCGLRKTLRYVKAGKRREEGAVNEGKAGLTGEDRRGRINARPYTGCQPRSALEPSRSVLRVFTGDARVKDWVASYDASGRSTTTSSPRASRPPPPPLDIICRYCQNASGGGAERPAEMGRAASPLIPSSAFYPLNPSRHDDVHAHLSISNTSAPGAHSGPGIVS